MSEAIISVVDSRTLLGLFGTRDQHLRRIRNELGVNILTQGDKIRIEGTQEAVERATSVVEQLKTLVERHEQVEPADVERLVASAKDGKTGSKQPASIDVYQTGRNIQPKTEGQARYLEAIARHELVFCVGPAGTGKTYLAVAMAVEALKQEKIRKIVLVRPAVEAGEKLGYLPGDLQAKINPYLRPLLDALSEMMDFDQVKRFTEQDLIEMIPLAYMRGRTLNEAFIILDEAQNTTSAQMKMFLTRMGMGSKIVVSGDTTQIDLPPNTQSGLNDAVRRLGDIQGISVVRLTGEDVVRHRLVQEIVAAYERKPKKRSKA